MPRRTGPISLDDFMNYSPSSKGEYLTKSADWPDLQGSKPPVKAINVVLHKRDSIYPIWRHNVPRIVQDKKNPDNLLVWGGNYTCWEEDDVLKNQYKRHDDGVRRLPPKKCGICKMIEWVYQEVLNERLSWTKEIFRFEATTSENTRVIHAGGITNLFGSKNLSDGEKAQLKKHGIFTRDSWMQSGWAKLNYLFLVVLYDHPEQGVQIAIEPSSLGDKIQTMIKDRMESLDERDQGDPQKHPYVMQWTFNPDKKIEFGKKYHARPMLKLPVTKDILKLIDGDTPDVDPIVTPFNQLTVRSSLEEAALIDMPWDDFFGAAEEEEDQASAKQAKRPSATTKKKAVEEEETDDEEDDDAETEEEEEEETEKAKDADDEEEETEEESEEESGEDDSEMEQCPKCDGLVKADATKCPHCGVKFQVEEEPPPPRRKKAIAAPAAKDAPSNGKKLSTPPKGAKEPQKGKKKGAFGDLPKDEDDVPF